MYPDYQQNAVKILEETIQYWRKRISQLEESLRIAKSELEWAEKLLKDISQPLDNVEQEEKAVLIDRCFEIVRQERKSSFRYSRR